MAIDSNVQVAVVSVIATAITTFGVVTVAYLNNRRVKEQERRAGIVNNENYDNRDVLERLLSLLDELQEKELMIASLKRRNRSLSTEITRLRQENTVSEERT